MILSINGKTYEAGELIAYVKNLEKENELLKADLEFSAKTFKKNKQTAKEYQKLVDEYSSEGADLQDRIKELEKEVDLWKKASENNSYKAFQLEKENAELKEQNTNLQEMLKTERSVTCKEEYLKKVTELEQENAELKDDNKVMADNYSKMEQKFYDNLIEAKDLIEDMYDKIPASHSDYYKDVMDRARQFLSEGEK